MEVLPDNMAVVIDIETTEASVAEARGTFPQPIEVAGCLIDCEYAIHEEFSMLVRPEPFDEFNEFVQSFTGIKQADIEKAPVFKDCWKDFAKFTRYSGYKLISYGAPFDFAVLRIAYGKIGVKWPHGFPFIDAISVAYSAAGRWGFKPASWSLGSMSERFNVEKEKKHRALVGARAVVAVLKEIATLGD